jgi:hypothetical protein
MDLLGLDTDNEQAWQARQEIPQDPGIQRILAKRNKLGYWGTPRDIFTWWPRKDTTFWLLGVLADFGLRRDDWEIGRACEYVFSTQLPGGAFGLRPPPKPYDCFTGILSESLAKLGYLGDQRLEQAYAWLAKRQRLDGGFWCKDTGQPGGPRQDEPSCAFGTLCALGALAVHPRLRDSETAKVGAQFLLRCWENKGKIRYAGHDSQIGTGWEKLKYPFTDYRILKYLDALAQLSYVRNDPRLVDMAELLISKRDEQGRFQPESVHRVYADFDFGQKNRPSRWITFLAYRILKRILVGGELSESSPHGWGSAKHLPCWPPCHNGKERHSAWNHH